MARLLRLCIIVGLLTFVASPPSFAAPTLQVSATEGLEQGQSITVGGSGFTPGLKGIAVGQCRVGYVGPSDCNLSGGATFRNADADGAIATVTIKLATSFGDIDCLKEPCIIAAAPLPTTSGPEEVAANTIEVPIYFGDAKPATAEAAPASVAAVAPAEAQVASSASPALLTAGAADNTVLYALVATNLALLGAGLYLGLGRQDRRRSAVAR